MHALKYFGETRVVHARNTHMHSTHACTQARRSRECTTRARTAQYRNHALTQFARTKHLCDDFTHPPAYRRTKAASCVAQAQLGDVLKTYRPRCAHTWRLRLFQQLVAACFLQRCCATLATPVPLRQPPTPYRLGGAAWIAVRCTSQTS